MSILPSRRFVSVEEYLQGELVGEIRHEYLGGDVYAMTGSSDRHNIVILNLAAALRPLIRGTPCQLFVNDMKLHTRVAGDEYFYYPDAMLACDPQDRATYYRTRPCLIVEVLSESTSRIDRREKFFAYTRIDSLQEYLLLAQDRPLAELHRRQDDWQVSKFTEGKVPLTCLNTEIPLETIYESVF